MKLVILGATGQTGVHVVNQALAAGHRVTSYVRQPGNLPNHPDLVVVQGQLNDIDNQTTAMHGADAVICCLGPEPGLGSAFKKQTLMTNAVPAIIASMRAAGVSRLVLMSALGVGESRRKTSGLARFAYSTFARTAYADKLVSEKHLDTSGLDWALIYPGVLTNDGTKRAAVVQDLDAITHIPGLPKVSRADVAQVLLDAAITGSWTHKTAVVTS